MHNKRAIVFVLGFVLAATLAVGDTLLKQSTTNLGPVNILQCSTGMSCSVDGGMGILTASSSDFWRDGGAAVHTPYGYNPWAMWTPYSISAPDGGVSLWLEARPSNYALTYPLQAPRPTMVLAQYNGTYELPTIEFKTGFQYSTTVGRIYGSNTSFVGSTKPDGGSVGSPVGLNLMGGPNIAFVRDTNAADPSSVWGYFTDTAPGGFISFAPPNSNAFKLQNLGARITWGDIAEQYTDQLLDGGCAKRVVFDAGPYCWLQRGNELRIATPGYTTSYASTLGLSAFLDTTVIYNQGSPPPQYPTTCLDSTTTNGNCVGSSGPHGTVWPQTGSPKGWEAYYYSSINYDSGVVSQTDGGRDGGYGSIPPFSTKVYSFFSFDAPNGTTCVVNAVDELETPGIIATCHVHGTPTGINDAGRSYYIEDGGQPANVYLYLSNTTANSLDPAYRYRFHFWENRPDSIRTFDRYLGENFE